MTCARKLEALRLTIHNLLFTTCCIRSHLSSPIYSHLFSNGTRGRKTSSQFEKAPIENELNSQLFGIFNPLFDSHAFKLGNKVSNIPNRYSGFEVK
jgi:hypothetical protein